MPKKEKVTNKMRKRNYGGRGGEKEIEKGEDKEWEGGENERK